LKQTQMQILDSYSHIMLSEEETATALIAAKRKKENLQKEQENLKRMEANRRYLTGYQWSYEQTKSFMQYRANMLFEGKFKLDEKNFSVFELLTHYFSNSSGFIPLAQDMGVKNPSLEKGILLAGIPGTGKTWLMKLFSKNQRQVFFMKNAKAISESYASGGWDGIQEYLEPVKNPVNDAGAFFHPIAGICIDDTGTEDVRQNFANKSNVIGDIIQVRYDTRYTGPLLHATTNLKADQLKDFYGERVSSRMKEVFNFIQIAGSDRRK